MKWSLQIAKVSGIRIYIHWSFLLLIVWVLIGGLGGGSTMGHTLYMLAFVLVIFLCVVLHELGHALTAKRFKYITKDIILLPIGGMARMDQMPEDPKQELLVALAGPAVNLLIALLLYPFIYWFGKMPTFLSTLFSTKDTFLFDVFVANIMLALFNLIPAFPMDGGRVLRAILAMKMTRLQATRAAARTGQVIAIFFFFIGLFYNPILAIIAVFVFLMAQAETEYVLSHSILHGYTVKDVILHRYYQVESSAPIAEAVKLLLDVQAADFLVTENGAVAGVLEKDDIIKVLHEKGNNATVKDAMKSSVRYLSPGMPLEQAYRELQTSGVNIMPVSDNGTLAGIITLDNILEFIMVKEINPGKTSRALH